MRSESEQQQHLIDPRAVIRRTRAIKYHHHAASDPNIPDVSASTYLYTANDAVEPTLALPFPSTSPNLRYSLPQDKERKDARERTRMKGAERYAPTRPPGARREIVSYLPTYGTQGRAVNGGGKRNPPCLSLSCPALPRAEKSKLPGTRALPVHSPL